MAATCTSESKAERSPSLSKSPKYRRSEESQQIFDGRDPNVVCLIRRRWSSNVVVYRARTVDDNGVISLHPKNPMDIFWLKCDRQSLEKHRKNGKADDRVELGRLERKFAYGVSYKKIKTEKEIQSKRSRRSRWSSFSCKGKKSKSRKSKKINTISAAEGIDQSQIEDSVQSESSVYSLSHHPVPHEMMDYNQPETEGRGLDTISENGLSYHMIFNALKSEESMHLELRIDPETKRPGLYGSISIEERKVECRLKEIYVALKTGRMGVLKVSSVTVCAIRCDDGQKVERVLQRD